MRITLIKPDMGRLAEGPFVDEARMEPLGLGVLAALTPPGVDVRRWDERVDAVDYDEATDLVAITVAALASCEWAIANKLTFAAFNILTPHRAVPWDPAVPPTAGGGPAALRRPPVTASGLSVRPRGLPTCPDDHGALTEVGWACRQRLNSLGSIVRRAMEPRAVDAVGG